MEKLNVLLIGAGGREHAIAWKLAQSNLLGTLYVAPGNPGTGKLGVNINIKPTDFESVKSTCINNNIRLVVVGPEEPLVKGIHDFFLSDKQLSTIPVIGPTKDGAMLEGSKDFAKGFMSSHNIPTAKYQTFTPKTVSEAKNFLKTLNPPYVLKADGLAAGKGVVIVDSYEEACKNLDEFFDGKFGDAGSKVVIEEFLKGIELSVFVLTDGNSFVLLPEAKDYKRVGEGDTGLNTGGMGAVSPVPFANAPFLKKVKERIVIPTINGLNADGIKYVGFIFIGLMNVNGDPYVIEYNVRMGDPETEVVMPRIESDLLELLWHCANGKLSETGIIVSQLSASTVIAVSGGYPGSYKKGLEISGTEKINDAIIFHSGTSTSNGKLVTSGGRVLACTGTGKSLSEALKVSYAAAAAINFEGKYYRKDIGKDVLDLNQ